MIKTFEEFSARLPADIRSKMEPFVQSYFTIGQSQGFTEPYLAGQLVAYMQLVQSHLQHPFVFAPRHYAIRQPHDLQRLGVEFFRPLVDLGKSCLQGPWDEIREKLAQGNNVILLANHQTEADPALIHLLLEANYADLAERMAFVAGERVIKDPVAVPLSMGRDLICVHSRRYIDHDPKLRAEKLLHNQRAIALLRADLKAGGFLLYVAPSGGRDRPNHQGIPKVAEFDPDVVELMRLLGQRGQPTHHYPLALATYCIFPPPDDIQHDLGEIRRTQGGALGVSLGDQVQWELLSPNRQERAAAVHQAVADMALQLYDKLELFKCVAP